MTSRQIHVGRRGNSKDDQFFTRAEDVERCWDFFHQHVQVPADARWLSPCVGSGAFYLRMPADRRTGYDLDPQPGVPGVQQQDFLQLSPLEQPIDPGFFVIENPPFGYRSSLAAAFVEQCFALGAAAVGFIVPAGMLPEADGSPSSVARRLRGGHIAASFGGIDWFQLPDGKRYEVRGCGFVVCLPGPSPVKASRRSCGDFVRISHLDLYEHRLNARVLAKADSCDVFVKASRFTEFTKQPVMFYEGDPPRDDIYLGIELLRDRDRVLEFLRGVDWMSVGRKSAARNVTIRKSHIQNLLMDEGFVDGRRTCESYITLDSLPDGTTRDNPRVRVSDAFIRSAFYPGQQAVHREWDDAWTGKIAGLKFYKQRDAVLAALEAADWDSIGRRAPTGVINLSHQKIRDVVMDAGFVDGRRRDLPGDDVATIVSMRPNASSRDDAVAACDLFIRATFYPSQWRGGEVVSREWKGWTCCFGVRAYGPDREAALAALEAEDWWARGRKSMNDTSNLSVALIREALADAGFG